MYPDKIVYLYLQHRNRTPDRVLSALTELQIRVDKVINTNKDRGDPIPPKPLLSGARERDQSFRPLPQGVTARTAGCGGARSEPRSIETGPAVIASTISHAIGAKQVLPRTRAPSRPSVGSTSIAMKVIRFAGPSRSRSEYTTDVFSLGQGKYVDIRSNSRER